MKAVIARISPITNSPVIFDVSSRRADGRIKAFLDGKDVEVGYDFYINTEYLPKDQALAIAKAYAKHAKIPEHDILIRQRFPKTNPGKPRNTPVADKSTAKKEEKGETLQQLVQELHDKETTKADVDAAVKPLEELAKEHGKKQEAPAKAPAKVAAKKTEEKPAAKQEAKAEEKTAAATSEKPEGAVVKRTAAEKAKGKRNYNKSPKRSEAAMKRYLADLGQVVEEASQVAEQPANAPAAALPDATKREIIAQITASVIESLLKNNLI